MPSPRSSPPESSEPARKAAAAEAVAPATSAETAAPALMEAVKAVLALGSALLLAIGPRGVARRALPAARRLLLPAAPRVPVDVAVVVRVEIVSLPGRARAARLGLTGR